MLRRMILEIFTFQLSFVVTDGADDVAFATELAAAGEGDRVSSECLCVSCFLDDLIAMTSQPIGL